MIGNKSPKLTRKRKKGKSKREKKKRKEKKKKERKIEKEWMSRAEPEISRILLSHCEC